MIPQIQPWIDEAELVQLKRVIDSTFVTEHELTKEFEDMIRQLTSAEHAISVCNGTMALFICLKVLGISKGDEVIVPNLTFVATANAIILAGATPVICEIDANTLCIDPREAEKLITTKTKAIMPVHLYGQSADMSALTTLAEKHNISIVEDAAQGIGVRFNGKHTGTFGKLGVLSFYGNKTITCGEGGVILTNDAKLARECYMMKNHGRDKKGVFVHDTVGYNFSFTEMQAAIGISQLNKLPEIIRRKQQIKDIYTRELASISGMRPVTVDERTSPVFWFTSYLSDHAPTLAEFLGAAGIQTRKFFYPLNLQPCYSEGSLLGNFTSDFSLSERIYSQGISLPSSYNLTHEEQHFIISKIKEFYADRH